jgi:SAM-dependent methyltransferase
LLEQFYQGNTYSCHEPASPWSACYAKREYVFKLLGPFLSKQRTERLLDFGCGAGDFLAQATRAGLDADVFEHLADHPGVLKTLSELLAPGGHVYIEVPNAASLRAKCSMPVLSRRLGFDERYRAFPIHLVYFDASTLRRLLERENFLVERMVTVGIGLEELLLQCERQSTDDRLPGRVNSHSRRGLLRRLVKTIILGAGLGENLGVICRPKD